MKHIMAATHGSEGAGRAIDLAAELAKATGAQLWILTVTGDLPAPEMRELAQAEDDIGAALDTISIQILTGAKARAVVADAASLPAGTVRSRVQRALFGFWRRSRDGAPIARAILRSLGRHKCSNLWRRSWRRSIRQQVHAGRMNLPCDARDGHLQGRPKCRPDGKSSAHQVKLVLLSLRINPFH